MIDYALFLIVLVFSDGSRGAFDDEVLEQRACAAQVEDVVAEPRYLGHQKNVVLEVPVCFSIGDATLEYWRWQMK